jgi:hypothetical protein
MHIKFHYNTSTLQHYILRNRAISKYIMAQVTVSTIMNKDDTKCIMVQMYHVTHDNQFRQQQEYTLVADLKPFILIFMGKLYDFTFYDFSAQNHHKLRSI